LQEGKAVQLSGMWQKSFVSLSEAMASKTLKVNELIDMEWKFGGVLRHFRLWLLCMCALRVVSCLELQ